MPNGKPGDRSDTDVYIHGRDVYAADINETIREVVDLGDAGELVDAVNLWDYGWGLTDDERIEVRQALEAKLDELRDEGDG